MAESRFGHFHFFSGIFLACAFQANTENGQPHPLDKSPMPGELPLFSPDRRPRRFWILDLMTERLGLWRPCFMLNLQDIWFDPCGFVPALNSCPSCLSAPFESDRARSAYQADGSKECTTVVAGEFELAGQNQHSSIVRRVEQPSPATEEEGVVMDCPRCGLINPASATRCDCGYDFEHRKTIEITQSKLASRGARLCRLGPLDRRCVVDLRSDSLYANRDSANKQTVACSGLRS